MRPWSARGLPVLKRAVEHGAYIPGINMSVGVIELNNKVRVVEKKYKNVYNSGLQRVPFTVKSFNGRAVTTISKLESIWTGINTLEERQNLIWQ